LVESEFMPTYAPPGAGGHKFGWGRQGYYWYHQYLQETFTGSHVEPDGCGGYVTVTENACWWTLDGTGNWTSPIIVDVLKVGFPDLLSGSGWKKGRTYERDVRSVRKVNLDFSSGPKYWEWVGPRAGLLVYGEGGVAPLRVSGKDLFGSRTFGKVWKDGYEALASLDGDRNGFLEGAELNDLFIWLDVNSNAVVDQGEILPASSYLRRISVNPIRDELGNASVENGGALLLDNSGVSTWDWWSIQYSFPSVVDSGGGKVGVPVVKGNGGAEDEPVILYQWRGVGGTSDKGSYGGVFRFVPLGGSDYLLLSVGYYDSKGYIRGVASGVTVDKDGTMGWKFGGLISSAKLDRASGNISGRSLLADGKFYDWEAWAVTDSLRYKEDIVASTLMNSSERSIRELSDRRMLFFEPSGVLPFRVYDMRRLK
jgi:hypothetical protein